MPKPRTTREKTAAIKYGLEARLFIIIPFLPFHSLQPLLLLHQNPVGFKPHAPQISVRNETPANIYSAEEAVAIPPPSWYLYPVFLCREGNSRDFEVSR
jgi:hypothetical protein